MNKIIYLDAAATALKPNCVIEAEQDFLKNKYANAGRGICPRAAAVDDMLKNTRKFVADFIGANSAEQIVFTSGTTDGLNRIVNLLKINGKLNDGTVVAVSDLDHHSARLPWYNVQGLKLVVTPLNENLDLDLSKIPYADVLVITAMSNVIGVAQNVKEIIKSAKQKNPDVITIVDAAQYVVHEKIDAIDWNADFICFSGHKIGADTGVGVMYIKNPDNFYPDKLGGGMLNKVIGDDILLNEAPYKFEAGTLPLTQIYGLESAINYLEKNRPDLNLIKFLYDRLEKNPKIKIISPRNSSLLSFVVKDMHALDFGALIGAKGICVRVGNMCATWIHNLLEISGSIRISVGAWNTMDEMVYVADIIESIVK